jgi:hypothetical protein
MAGAFRGRPSRGCARAALLASGRIATSAPRDASGERHARGTGIVVTGGAPTQPSIRRDVTADRPGCRTCHTHRTHWSGTNIGITPTAVEMQRRQGAEQNHAHSAERTRQ